jgi:ubiquinone/menaquinone biosynthesis C-methylase UbiE
MTRKNHEVIVETQFGPQAQSYVTSAVHAGGPDLDDMARLASEQTDISEAIALDLGCGGGHAAFRLAPLVKQVVAYDLSEAMLGAVAAEAGRRRLDNVVTQQGAAETLPCEPASFDVAVTRYSAHHWRDLPAGLAQMRRVLKPGGLAVCMDVVSPGVPLFDSWLQTLELLRDPSHVRNYSATEWLTMLISAGFAPEQVTRYRLRLEFSSWIKRMNTPDAHVAAIRSLQRSAGSEVLEHFAIEEDGSFTIDTLLIAAR